MWIYTLDKQLINLSDALDIRTEEHGNRWAVRAEYANKQFRCLALTDTREEAETLLAALYQTFRARQIIIDADTMLANARFNGQHFEQPLKKAA